jgi:uronate dehydrogenase
VWGVSNNTRSYWEQTGANDDANRLGYQPQDNAEDYAEEILKKANPLDAVGQRYQGGGFASIDFTPPEARGKRGG